MRREEFAAFCIGTFAFILALVSLSQRGPPGAQGPRGYSSGSLYFFNDGVLLTPDIVGPPQAYVLSRELLVAPVQNVVMNADGLVSRFITEIADPNELSIPSGIWEFHNHVASVTGTPSGGPPELYYEVYTYNAGVSTLLGTTSAVPLNDVPYNQWYDNVLAFPTSIPISANDRIEIRMYVQNITGSQSVTFSFGLDNPAQVLTTLAIALAGATGATGATGSIGLTGATGASGTPGPIAGFGNVILVDQVYGNDGTGVIDGTPFQTVNAAMTYLNGLSQVTYPNVTVWIMPGAYTLTSGLTMRANSSIRGLSTQTSKLTWAASAPGSTATLLTMASNSRVEDVTLTITSTNATTNLVGVAVANAAATSSKLRTCVVTVDNSSLAVGTATNVYGISVTGTAALTAGTFSFNFTRGVTINVFSNGAGAKRGIYMASENQITFRDTNFYVRNPTNTASTGTYVGCETADPGGIGSIQFRTCSIYGCQQQSVLTSLGYAFTGSDVLQSFPASGFNIYGIQIGPGTDLVNKSAGTKPFTTYVTPTVLTYALNGSVSNNARYYWPGTLSTGDSVETFYRIQQDCVLNGASVNLRTAPGGTNSVTWTVRKSTTNVPPGVPTTMTLTVSGASKTATNYNTSVDLLRGDFISVQSSATGGDAVDFILQLDIF